MKARKAKLLGLLLAAVTAIGMIPTFAFAGETTERIKTDKLDLSQITSTTDKLADEGWKWEVEGNNTYTLTLQDFHLKTNVESDIEGHANSS